MLEPLIYPVSGVLKLWHILMHSVFGMNDSTAWVVSILGLVVTVRVLLLPAFWAQAKAVRTGVAMRPEQAALAEEYATRTDKESVAEHEQKLKDLRERHNYSIAAGCIPILIQIPVFLGLYQVLLRLARPASTGAEITPDTRIGFLRADEIQAFSSASINGIPLPAYISMPADALARLGTTSEEVRNFLLPVLIIVVVATISNMLAALIRSSKTLDWESKAARGSNRFLILMTVLTPVLLFTLAFTAPLPVAIILYWFANNLWTLAQSLIIYPLVNRKIPLHESFEEFSRERREAAQAADREKRQIRWETRRRKALGALQPWKIPEIRRELIAEKSARKEATATEKAEKKAISKAKREASAALQKERLAQRREERAARKQARSNNPQAEPRASDAPDPAQSAED